MSRRYTTREIAERVGGRLVGAGDVAIEGVEQLEAARGGQISFIRDDHRAKQWGVSEASAALISEGVAVGGDSSGRPLIYVPDADLALAEVLGLFAPPVPGPAVGVHPRAVVDGSAVLGAGVAVGPGCVVGARTRVGDGCVLHANVVLSEDVVLGPGCRLYAGVVIRERCELGARVIVHPNAVIGADGFGYRPAADGSGLVKIPQIGVVRMGDDVEIGAGTCIDRGKFAATTIGRGTKIDNLCQIGHNSRIGEHCVLAGQVGVAGSVVIEDWAMIGGQVGIADHVRIGRDARVTAQSGVIGDVPAGVVWGGMPAQEYRKTLRDWAMGRRLTELIKALKLKSGPSESPADRRVPEGP